MDEEKVVAVDDDFGFCLCIFLFRVSYSTKIAAVAP
jgi:hypothetical protein